MKRITDSITDYRISSKGCLKNKIKTYVGRVQWYQDGRYLYSDSCGIYRLTASDAHHDAELIVADRLNDLYN